MKSRFNSLLLVVTAVCACYALSSLAAAQDAPTPPTPPAAPSAMPQVPAVPEAVPFTQAPAAPAAPAMPPMAAMPAFPAAPPAPPEPASPSDWNDEHSVSISDGRHQPASDCSDLHIRFDDRDAVMKSEERTLTKAEAPSLRVRPHTNGGVQVQGWDKDVYSVTACKAAANYDGDAERILSQIKLSIQDGQVSTSGPSDERDWTVYASHSRAEGRGDRPGNRQWPAFSLQRGRQIDRSCHQRPHHSPRFLRRCRCSGLERSYHYYRRQRQPAHPHAERSDLHQSGRKVLERFGPDRRRAEWSP